MKLYATTTSERASKGQGGNEYIDIDVFDEKQQFLARLVFMKNEDETSGCEYILVEDDSYRHHSIEIAVNRFKSQSVKDIRTLKGKSQKGEKNEYGSMGKGCLQDEIL